MDPHEALAAAEIDSEDRSRFVQTALERHEAALVRYALGLLDGDLERARDCVQDTFLRLWEQDPASVADHLAQWLFTVCRHRALDLQRKDRRMTPLAEADLDAREAAEASPALAAERREDTAAVADLLAGLPPNQREVVRLKFQHQLSYQEIATITSLSVGNVGFLLHTALRTLRHRMAQLDRIHPARPTGTA